ncbi:MAG: hypothetical protein ACK58T_50430, partial [Phycisphaerae bacterium]
GLGCLGAANFGITGFDESFWGAGRERRRTRPVASTTRAAIPRGAAGEVDRERESGSSASFAGYARLGRSGLLSKAVLRLASPCLATLPLPGSAEHPPRAAFAAKASPPTRSY